MRFEKFKYRYNGFTEKRVLKHLNIFIIFLFPLIVAVIYRNSSIFSFSIFVVMFLQLADSGGVYSVRFRILSAACVILISGSIFAVLFKNIPSVTVILILLWTFFFGLISVFGYRGRRLGSISVISFIIFMLSPAVTPDICTCVIIITSGFGWISVLKLWRWSYDPYHPLYSSAADYYSVICSVDGVSSDNDYMNVQRVRNIGFLAIRDLKKNYNSTVAGLHQVLRIGEFLFDTRQDLYENLKRLQPAGVGHESIELLREKIIKVHQILTKSIRNFGSNDTNTYETAMNELADSFITIQQEYLKKSDFDTSSDFSLKMDSIELYINLLKEAGETIHRVNGKPPLKRKKNNEKVKENSGNIDLLVKNLTLRSEIFRHSLRLSITLAAASAAEIILKIPFGYWIPISTAIILKPDPGSSVKRALERIGGVSAIVAAYFLFPDTGVISERS